MLIGLVTEQPLNTGKNWFKRLFRIKTYKKIQNIETGIDVLAVELPYSVAELAGKSSSRVERWLSKIIERLKRQTETVILSDGVKELCKIKGILPTQYGRLDKFHQRNHRFRVSLMRHSQLT